MAIGWLSHQSRHHLKNLSKCMKNRDIRMEFELYLETVGRDPSVYHEEEWQEVPAISIDP